MPAATPQTLAIVAKPAISEKHTKFVLEFELEYQGDVPLEVISNSLPGQRFYFVDFTFNVKRDYLDMHSVSCPDVVDDVLAVDDPGVAIQNIKGGMKFKATVDLADHIENLTEIAGKCDLVVYWTYHLLSEVADTPRLVGAAVFPSSGEPIATGPTAGQIFMRPE